RSFDIIYSVSNDNGSNETSGVQASPSGPATTFSCGTSTLTNGLDVTYTLTGGLPPTCNWSPGPNMPSVIARHPALHFPPSGSFSPVSGCSPHRPGSEFLHPFKYDPANHKWTTHSASYPDNQVNDMACGVLTQAGTPCIYCVGGSAAGATTATGRVFCFNPAT